MKDEVFERYRNDPTFNRIVEFMRSMLREHSTPSELREALLLAQYIHEMRNPQPYARSIYALGTELAVDAIESAEVRRK